MELNETVSIIGNMFSIDVFGSPMIVAIFVILVLTVLAFVSRSSILEFGIIFIMPALLVMALYGALPDVIRGGVLIICGFITALGLFRVISLRTL